jgi:hypothetical protein
LPDGPSQQLQVTYGKHQTTEYSNLKTLISDYIAAGGKYANDLEHYIPLLGRLPMHSNQTFIQLLKDAGKNRSYHGQGCKTHSLIGSILNQHSNFSRPIILH